MKIGENSELRRPAEMAEARIVGLEAEVAELRRQLAQARGEVDFWRRVAGVRGEDDDARCQRI